MIGHTISRYRIVEKIGEGGMGVVYKAEDVRLGRPVALKFLAPHLGSNEEVRKRFIREAQAAASLNHANICTVYEIDEAQDQTFIAMAYIEGQDLDERIAAGPLKLSEALDIAQQVASGLQAAHEKGIVHRDIKAANIMVDDKGRATIMDFGLARLKEASQLTQRETTLGTAAYMSPEQAMGQPVDQRSDVWALGVVLYEMVAGARPFQGQYNEALLYEVVNQEHPPLTSVRAGVPMELEWIVGKALAKQAAHRYQQIQEMAVDLANLGEKVRSGRTAILPAQSGVTGVGVTPWENPFTKYRVMETVTSEGGVTAYRAEDAALGGRVAIEVTPESSARRRARQRKLERIALLACGLLAVLLAVLWVANRNVPAEDTMPLRKFSLVPPGGVSMAAISPDGKHIAYIAQDGALWIHPLAEDEPHKVEGVDEALHPFWSPDSQFVGFVIQSEIRKVSLRREIPTSVARLPAGPITGAAWSPGGESIVFTVFGEGIFEVPARGGAPRKIIEHPHAETPSVLALANGERALLFAKVADAKEGQAHNIELAVPESAVRQTLATVPYQHPAPFYSPSGHVLYVSQTSGSRTIWALPFSLATLQVTSEAFPIGGHGSLPSVASDGTLIYLSENFRREQLVLRDRSGEKLGTIGRSQDGIEFPALSSDGNRVAAIGSELGQRDVWVHEIGRVLTNRLTFDSTVEIGCAWSPADELVAFGSSPGDIYARRADTVGGVVKLSDGSVPRWVLDWSADGEYVLYVAFDSKTKEDIGYLRRKDGGQEYEDVLFLQSPWNETLPKFSPDGKWIAYVSDESGRAEVYICRFPDGAGKRQVSQGGGTEPHWTRGGEELIYLQEDVLKAVALTTDPRISAGVSRPLFQNQYLRRREISGLGLRSTVFPDGQKVIVVEPVGESEPPVIRVVQNWLSEFQTGDRRGP